MKIGFLGAGGTGKTTTLNLLIPVLGLPAIRSVGREVMLERNLKEEDQWKMTPTEKSNLQLEIFQRKVYQDRRSEEGIAERTLLDSLIYSLFWSSELIPDELARTMEILVQENLRKYDKLFYFPITFTPPIDQVRQPKLAPRLMVDAAIRGYLEKMGVTYFAVPEGTPEERAGMVLAVIRGYSSSAQHS